MPNDVDLTWLRELDRGERNRELQILAKANKMNVFEARRQVHEVLKRYGSGKPNP